MKIAIITDSSCGLKNLKEIDNLYLVPLMISKDNGEQVADDGTLSTDEFYKLNDSQLLKTSQSIPGQMMEKWDELLKTYDQVVCILISKGLSGQYSTCKMLSKDEPYNGKVFVIDTNSVSVVLKRQLMLVDVLLKEGKNGQEIEDIIETNYNQVVGYIIPKSLKQLVRGGRISKAAAGLAKFLKITPILKYDGTIDKQGKTRTFKKAVEESLKLLKKNYPDSNVVDISYSRVNNEVLELVKKVVAESNYEIGLFDEMPNIITCHTGRETFAFMPYQIWGEKKWK